MTIQANAVYADGSLHLEQPLPLAEGAKVRIAVQTNDSPQGQSEPKLDPLAQVIGIGEGPAAGDVAAQHDDYLTSMAIMNEIGVADVFTGDAHFTHVNLGFNVLD